jgi:hypothetical protein
MSQLSDNSEIEQSSSACTLATVAAAQSIQITRYSSFCTSIQFQFIRSVYSLSSLTQSTQPVNTQPVNTQPVSPLTQFTHLVHSFSPPTQSTQPVNTHSVSLLTQSTHSVHSASQHPPSQSIHPVHPPSSLT